MTPFPAPVSFVDANGRLTDDARKWIAKIVEELRAKDETIAVLEARIAALEP